MEAKVYNQEGQESGQIKLPAEIFSAPWKPDLVHQVIMAEKTSHRRGTAHTKGRGEVAGGGKKPWRQKGTGRARHGSIRSPIWRGGGATHGPTKERNYARTVNKKMTIEAVRTLLAQKWRDGEVLFVDHLTLAAPKTKVARGYLSAWSKITGFNKINYQAGKRALIAMPTVATATRQSFRNFSSVLMQETRQVNPSDLITYKYLVVTEPLASLEVLTKRLS
ncbi:MAG: 50S ribosomal protein L4 [Patescibacteria group bacterium]